MKPVVLMTDSRATISSEVEIVHLPLIGIRPLPVVRALAHHHYDWLLFTSKNAVELFFLHYPDVTFSNIASIGKKTSLALAVRNIKIDYEPPDYHQESFIECAADRFDRCTVLIPCSAKARPMLTDFLKRRAEVTRINLYEPVASVKNAKKMNELVVSGSIDVVVLMSPSAVNAYFTQYDVVHLPVLAVGPVTSQALSRFGQPHITANQSTKESILQKIIEMRDNHVI
ncbi:uroporphyrinogen-III synthase [Macrococcus lamae]|nr:uroporphyrinogen-III synthase [Macrococcus lamae]